MAKPAKQPQSSRATSGSWKPGQSGNPKGRAKRGETMTDALKVKADKDEIADKLIALANDGDLAALKYIYDRIDGKPRESVDIEHSGGLSINIINDPVLFGDDEDE